MASFFGNAFVAVAISGVWKSRLPGGTRVGLGDSGTRRQAPCPAYSASIRKAQLSTGTFNWPGGAIFLALA